MKVDEVTVTEKRGILRIKVAIEGDEFCFGVQNGELVLVSSVGSCLSQNRRRAFAIARDRLKAWSPQVQETLPF